MAASREYCNVRQQILLAKLPGQIQIGDISRCTVPLKRMKRVLRPVRAKSGDRQQADSGDWSIVDANMILLRKRISELKSQEDNYELPEDWKEWEKKIYPSYHTNVIQAIGWLHYTLIHARPSVGIALLSLITLCVPTSFLVAIMAMLHQLTANS